MSRRDKPKYKTFASFMRAFSRGKIDKKRLEFVCWTGSCAVTISLRGEPIAYDDDGDVLDRAPSTLLLRCDTSDMFVMEVAAAYGGDGRIA